MGEELVETDWMITTGDGLMMAGLAAYIELVPESVIIRKISTNCSFQ